VTVQRDNFPGLSGEEWLLFERSSECGRFREYSEIPKIENLSRMRLGP
jgi:hypothetical protein